MHFNELCKKMITKYAAILIINVTLVPSYQFSIERTVYVFTTTQIAVQLQHSISATHLGDPVFDFEHTGIK
jgi:hypothetical protein